MAPQEMPFAAAAQEVQLSLGAPDPTCCPVQLPPCLLPTRWDTRSSPTVPRAPSHRASGQGGRVGSGSLRRLGRRPAGDGLSPGSSHTASCPSPFALRAAPLTPQQPWCPALSGYRPSWGEARAFPAVHSTAEPSVTLQPPTAASAHSKAHVCLLGRCFAVLQGPGRWQRAVAVAQPPPCPAMTPGRHTLRLAVGFVALSV